MIKFKCKLPRKLKKKVKKWSKKYKTFGVITHAHKRIYISSGAPCAMN